MANVFKRTDIKDQRRWYYRYIDESGKVRVRAGFRDKKQTERLATEREETARRIREGLVDPAEERLKEYRARPIGEHVDEYRTMLTARKRTQTHVRNTLSDIQLAINTLGWQRISDINAAELEHHLTRLRTDRDWSPRTYNSHLVACKSFTSWLRRTGRVTVDPLAMLSRMKESGERKRPRRALSETEITKLLDAADSGPILVKVPGPDRAMLYRVLFATGLRFSEALSMTPESFELDHPDGPRVRIGAVSTKNGDAAFQPLPPAVAETLGPWLVGREPGKPVWRKPHNACRAWLKKDLAAAGVPYKDAHGAYADFHATRHTFVTMLNRAGVPLATAMSLARHSDPKLTTAVYHHHNEIDRRAAIEATFGGPESADGAMARIQIRTRTPLAGSQQPASPRTTTKPDSTLSEANGDIAKWLNGRRFCIDSHEDAPPRTGGKESTPRRTRTFNPLIKSQLLYRLS